MARLQGLDANLNAFLDMIAWSEGTPPIPGGDDGYGVLVGATQERPAVFSDYSRHPHRQVPPFINRALDSTASGRYQITCPTWEVLAMRLGLTDFGPEAQDQACLELLREHGAWGMILQGQLRAAIAACGKEWASFPGSQDGQHEQHYDYLASVYQRAGGSLAQQ